MKVHPAIDDDEVAIWNACRQLMLSGAKVEVTNYGWQRNKREAFDTLCFRGLANRQSNGDAGKYEVFTYTPTEKLLAWAQHCDSLRVSFDVALKGRDVKNEIRNFRRRARYAQQQDRAKYFPREVTTTEAYIKEFCRLNSLKP